MVVLFIALAIVAVLLGLNPVVSGLTALIGWGGYTYWKSRS